MRSVCKFFISSFVYASLYRVASVPYRRILSFCRSAFRFLSSRQSAASAQREKFNVSRYHEDSLSLSLHVSSPASFFRSAALSWYLLLFDQMGYSPFMVAATRGYVSLMPYLFTPSMINRTAREGVREIVFLFICFAVLFHIHVSGSSFRFSVSRCRFVPLRPRTVPSVSA